MLIIKIKVKKLCVLYGAQVLPTRPPHSAHNFLTLILIINIPHDVWILENIFINNYTLDECTYHCITYSVTAHPDDDQARPKHVGATD
jgi:hypothetical protein